MAAAMDGLDALVFTGGIGQASAEARTGACAGLGFLGIAVDGELNVKGQGDRVVSTATAAAAVVVVESREDIELARLVRQVLLPHDI